MTLPSREATHGARTLRRASDDLFARTQRGKGGRNDACAGGRVAGRVRGLSLRSPLALNSLGPWVSEAHREAAVERGGAAQRSSTARVGVHSHQVFYVKSATVNFLKKSPIVFLRIFYQKTENPDATSSSGLFSQPAAMPPPAADVTRNATARPQSDPHGNGARIGEAHIPAPNADTSDADAPAPPAAETGARSALLRSRGPPALLGPTRNQQHSRAQRHRVLVELLAYEEGLMWDA